MVLQLAQAFGLFKTSKLLKKIFVITGTSGRVLASVEHRPLLRICSDVKDAQHFAQLAHSCTQCPARRVTMSSTHHPSTLTPCSCDRDIFNAAAAACQHHQAPAPSYIYPLPNSQHGNKTSPRQCIHRAVMPRCTQDQAPTAPATGANVRPATPATPPAGPPRACSVADVPQKVPACMRQSRASHDSREHHTFRRQDLHACAERRDV